LGKAYVFEFADVEFISMAFAAKGFFSIVLSNAFSKIG